MTNDDFKKELEIKHLEYDLKQKKTNNIFQYVKYVLGLIGAITVFFFITSEDSALNRRASNEEISRERALIIIDLLKEDNPELRKLGLEIIKQTYPNDNKWITEIENLIIEQADNEKIHSLKLRYEDFLNKKIEYSKKVLNKSSYDFEINSIKLEIVEQRLDEIFNKIKSVDKKFAKRH